MRMSAAIHHTTHNTCNRKMGPPTCISLIKVTLHLMNRMLCCLYRTKHLLRLAIDGYDMVVLPSPPLPLPQKVCSIGLCIRIRKCISISIRISIGVNTEHNAVKWPLPGLVRTIREREKDLQCYRLYCAREASDRRTQYAVHTVVGSVYRFQNTQQITRIVFRGSLSNENA